MPACHGQGQTLGVGLPVLIGLLQEAGAVVPVQAAVEGLPGLLPAGLVEGAVGLLGEVEGANQRLTSAFWSFFFHQCCWARVEMAGERWELSFM